jgi:predicted nucleic acid-binding protein
MAKADILDKIIKHLQKNLAITNQVYNESTSKIDAYDAKIIKKRIEEKAIRKKRIKNLELCKNIQDDFNLGKGEAETIVFCLENKISLITDDKKAMKACKILRIKFTTVPNLLIRLYNKGLVTKIEADLYLKRLEKFGRYSNDILQKIKGDLK